MKYPVTKDYPNYLFCNFPWFVLVSIRINEKEGVITELAKMWCFRIFDVHEWFLCIFN